MRNCFCCDKELKEDVGDEPTGTCNYHDATCWQSYGNWTSKVFDGLVDKFLKLEIVLCDDCLRKKIKTAYGWLKVTTYKDEKFMGIPIVEKQECGEFKKYEPPQS